MKTTKLITGSAICLSTLALGNLSGQAQNLLSDPSFESGAPGAWSTFNGAAFSTAEARTGTFSMLDSGGGGFSVPGSFQTLSASAGLEYDLTGWGFIATAPGGTSDGALQITFFDGANGTGNNLGSINISNGGTPTGAGNAQLSNTITSASPLGQWIFLDTGIAQAPVGTQSLQVFTIVLDQSPTAVFFDDLNLVQVPEPSSLALAGMVLGLPFYFWQRRKN